MAFLFDPGLRAQLDSGGIRVTATAFTPDNSRAVIAHSDGAFAIWDLRTGELLVRLYNEPADTLYFRRAVRASTRISIT